VARRAPRPSCELTGKYTHSSETTITVSFVLCTMAVLQIDLNKPHWTLRIVTKIAVSGISRTKEIPIYVPPNMKIRQPAKKKPFS